MCGRYSLTTQDLQELGSRFNFNEEGIEYKPHYNIAPSQDVLAVVGNSERHARYMRWGLIPFWSKDSKVGYKLINSRDDKVSKIGTFKPLVLGSEKTGYPPRRCLIIADGFFGWRKEGKDRIPMRVTLKDGEPFAFASLWSSWRNPETEEKIATCTIVTTSSNELVAKIHPRMPVILPFEAEEMWLNPEIRNQETLLSLLKPFPAGSMDSYQVSELVNSAKNDLPECILSI